MSRRLRYLLCAAGALALLAAAAAEIFHALDRAPTPPAAAASRPGATCSHPTVSAINEYCENVPSATGGNQAGPGLPPLAGQLPTSASSRLQGAGGTASRASQRRHGHARSRETAASRLLGLPAPSIRLNLAATEHGGGGSWSLFPGLLIVLAVLALGLSAVAFARRVGQA